MSIKHSLLALLSEGPRCGYQLCVEFEKGTGGTWPLNIGQVYATPDRLEREGLVIDDGEGHRFYRLAEAGAAEVSSWFAQPVAAVNPPCNELAIKLAIAVTTPGVDVDAVIQAQRMALTTTMQQYTRARRAADEETHPRNWPGDWCSNRWSTRWRPKCAGWTTARLGLGNGSRRADQSLPVRRTLLGTAGPVAGQ